MRTIAILPARMSSGRFPGKPLQTIEGMSMIGHCFKRTSMSKNVDRVVVATPDKEVEDDIKRMGGDVIVTPEFDMCNDRIAWAYNEIRKTDGDYDLVINVQGDQPLVYPEMIDAILEERARGPAYCSYTLVEPVTTLDDFYDLNRVKVLFREKDNTLIYMSRAPIPSPKKKGVLPERAFKHVAIIAFEPDFLEEFLRFSMTYNEEVEGIDYNRVVEMGRDMKVLVTEIVSDTVDTPEDLERVRKTMKSDALWLQGKYRPRA